MKKHNFTGETEEKRVKKKKKNKKNQNTFSEQLFLPQV